MLADLRADGNWLRTAKHATTEVIDAGNTMLKAADEIEALSTALREMREALMESVNVLLPMARAWVDHVEAPNDRKEVERIAGLLCAAIERSTKL